MTDLITKILTWAHERNLVQGSNPQAQMLKLLEEAGELASGIAKGNQPLIKDSIGDLVVVLTILAAQHDLGLVKCVETAYDEIKDRKGMMIDGIFVKEVDL